MGPEIHSNWGILILLLASVVHIGAYTRRNKEDNEITPVSGYGSGLDKSAKLARAPIDRDLDTYVYIYDYGDTTWYTMNLGDDRVFCIDEVIDFTSNGRKYTAWYCGSDRCSCRGSSCDSIFLSIFTTGQTLRNLPPRDCKYGNRVKLYKPSGISMSLYEVAVVGRAAECSSGTYMSSNGCQQCRENTYSRAGASSCTSCPSGKVSPAGSTTEGDCYFEKCGVGDYLTESGCQGCPPGQTSSEGSMAESDCYYPPCSAGDYMTESGCQQCRENTFSGAGASSCTSCPSGKVSPAGSTTEGDCYFEKCGVGDYLTESGCQGCPPGQTSSEGSTAESDCYYPPCSAGDYMTESGCQQCSENTFSGAGASSCTSCPLGEVSAKGSSSISACLSAACKSDQETDPEYGEYLWPVTVPGKMVEMKCKHNPESLAYKRCDEKTLKFGVSDFKSCSSKLYKEITIIHDKTETIETAEEQRKLAEEIRGLVESYSSLLKSEDVKKTADIIDNLLDFDGERHSDALKNNVSTNILKTLDGVHKSTMAQEIAKSDVASRIRSSVDKLADKISEDTERDQVYLKEETVGVVVTEASGKNASFAVYGEKTNYSRTQVEQEENASVEPFLFSVNVPVDTNNSSVTVVLYNSPKFFPDEENIEDITHALAMRLTNSNGTKTATRKVVSMVTEINYGSSTGRVDFDSGNFVEMAYNVQEEPFSAYYKMDVKRRYECAYYNTTTQMWLQGSLSGCTTKLEKVKDGDKLVSCQCSHMTSFAVLMSFDSDYDPIEETVTSYLLGISLGCLVLTIIAFFPAKEMLKSRPVRLNLLLASSLIFSIISFYLMEIAVMNEIKANRVPSESDSASAPCVIVAFMMNYFWLCQMAWMVCEALVMYRALVSAVMNSHIHKYMLKFNLACWGAPLIFPIIGVSWGGADFANPKTCFLRRKYGLVTFYGPVVLCTVLNIFLFVRISWSTFSRKSMDTGSMSLSAFEKQKRRFKFAITVMTLLGVGWMFGFFLIFLETNMILIRWLFILSNCTQGIFIFVLYVVLNKDLIKVWRKLLKLSPKVKTSHSSASTGVPSTSRGKSGAGYTDKSVLSNQHELQSQDGTKL
ncbi:hypothetical protein ACHWQZ_G008238 [Mnemiopsis leidyi]